MTRTTARRTVFRAAVTAVLFSATACTSAAGSAPSGDGARAADPSTRPLHAVERATGRAGSARVESTTVMGGELSLKAAGTLGWRDGLTGTLTITYTAGTTAETMRRLGTTALEARYLPDAYYARLGDRFADRVGGRHWIRYAYEDLERLGGDAGAGFADQLRETTPHLAVKSLLAADDVREVGAETTRGRRTTHWTGTVGGDTARTVDIWVDDRDLLVKKVERGRTETGKLTQTVYYSDYGAGVVPERPPAADTADFRELLKARGDGS
ncbi:conserved exported protein of unknown function [Streptomyces ambofaciens ATCC 23877]|uniref:Lipoprotein n=1 Tax=Streptomyces ambofaciens (strain ATCC 23877 / 3486 / DSM 40053 / JCM 4204 / NBRC 12836 / NRRL B-2516) TaxID=278992 RepID=A0A0K2AWY3_STRA7|nr:hypothetical protein [Streptomyces ambofaciens]AKZ57514.1 conserved exported protein of unknown function [Streptomyces ambofaciens ATCC 23877]